MVYPYLKSRIKLEIAVVRCRNQKKACIWSTPGLAINYNDEIPPHSIVGRTMVIVACNDTCLLMLLCFTLPKKEAIIVAVGEFSNLEALKEKHPEIFEKSGTFEPI